jgi:hypothetical protein
MVAAVMFFGMLMSWWLASWAGWGFWMGGPISAAGGLVWALYPVGFLGYVLQPASIGLPPRRVAGRHVVVPVPQSYGPIDEFPDDIGMPGMSISSAIMWTRIRWSVTLLRSPGHQGTRPTASKASD